jgi:hypothetical protein
VRVLFAQATEAGVIELPQGAHRGLEAVLEVFVLLLLSAGL